MDLWAGWSLGSNFMLITVVFKTILATNPSCDVFLVENVELSKQGQKKVTFIALHWKRKGINKDHFTFNDRCSIYLKQAVNDTAPGKSAELSFFFFFLLNSYVPSLSVLGLLYNSPHPKKTKNKNCSGINAKVRMLLNDGCSNLNIHRGLYAEHCYLYPWIKCKHYWSRVEDVPSREI